MEFSLIHAGLAAGAALAALPVILHLFMKQTPKRVVFPALRLIRERQKRSHKKLKVKNWLLLLARMALVALMALALARPRLFSETSLGDEEVPTAIALVFDTSLSMGYKEQPDKSLLDVAKERAGEVLKKTPDSSQIFVVDSSEPGVPVALSPAAARKRVEGLALHAANRPLNAALGQAYAAVVDCDRPRHEVYVLTDLARSSWEPGRPVEGLDLLKKVKSGVVTYVLRLTPKDFHDVSIVEAKPSVNVATQGEAVEIRATLRSRGPASKRVAEFFFDGNVKKGEQPVDLPADGEVEVKFTTPKLDPAVALHQGRVRVSGAPDPLPFDDERFFTFKVQPALKVVIVTDLAIDAEFVRDALAPDPATLPPGTPRPFRVDQVRSPEFAGRAEELLKDAACVFVNNVAELDPSVWGRLGAYVRDGGGLVIGLGDRCRVDHYANSVVAQLAPATPVKKNAAAPTTFGKINDATHPLFSRFPEELDAVLAQVPVSRYWSVTPHQGARTLLTFADGAPALLERTIPGPKAGHVLLWTTPLARRVDRESDAAWNEFPIFWGFFHLMTQTVPFLAGISTERLIYEAGEDVVLPIDPGRRFKNYIVQGPDARPSDRLSPPVTHDSLVIVSPQPIGQWSVLAAGDDGSKATLGFSVNPPTSESHFSPLEKRDLDALFGKAKYALADDPQSLERVTQQARIGHEIFPWLMGVILILVTVEGLLANRFYREGPSRPAARVTS
jgi:aerotolerance regulator-like protein